MVLMVLLVCNSLETVCNCSPTCILKSDFNRRVSSTCPWTLDLHNRRPGRAANTSRSLCLQRPGRKHAPNLPLLHRTREVDEYPVNTTQWDADTHSTVANWAGDNSEMVSPAERDRFSLQSDDQRRAACVRTDTTGHAEHCWEVVYLLRGLVPNCWTSSFWVQ